ncbi:NeuD/PglB/VioB family sugar acetyltransferase [Clostridium sp.]|uniref:NeuD/PglB/VioB family sugar acetyltransferase n=1 Tax=Clostridium sp. TaxID=1506 RepID=UPI003D6D2009
MGALLIIGAGGHGRVVAEAAQLEGKWNDIAFLDDREGTVFDYKIIGKLDEYEKFQKDYEYAIVCLGDNVKRMDLIEKLLKVGFKVPVIVHPRAWVSRYSEIGSGCVILAGAVINTGAKIGRGCIVNINSCIDHDTTVSDGVHVCSGATIRSMCSIGRLSYIGAGATVKSGGIVKERFILQGGTVI